MVVKVATAVEIIDGASFRLRTDQIVRLEGCNPPGKGTEHEKKAIAKLTELVLKKKVTIDSHSIDTFGRSNSQVNLEDGTDVNKIMIEFIAKL